MNMHCSKDIVTSIVYTYNYGKYFILIFSMFDGIAEHEGRKNRIGERDFFLYEIAYFFFYCFFLINFYLTI